MNEKRQKGKARLYRERSTAEHTDAPAFAVTFAA
jgi:hypothetical protein